MAKLCSIPGSLITIAYNIIRLAQIDKDTVSVTFNFDNEKIEFECHSCNEIISGLTTNFLGQDIS